LAGIGIRVLNVPHTALEPRLARKWPFAATLPVESRTRHTTFASKTRAEPVSVKSAPEFAMAPGLGAVTAIRSLVARGSPPISMTRCAGSGMYARHGLASSIATR
jgi:hypothetical protein